MTAISGAKRLAAWSDRFRGELLFGFGSALTSAVTLGGNLVAAHSVSPSEMGILQTLLLVPTYCSFLHLGVFNGLNRNIAFYQGRGDHARVQRMVDSSWRTAKVVAGIGAGIGVVLLAYFALTGAPALWLWGLVAIIPMLMLEPFSVHLESVFVSSRHFQRLGRVLCWQNATTAVASTAPLIAGAAGFIFGRLVFAASRFAFRAAATPIRPARDGTWDEMKNLAHTGFPLLIAGTAYAYLGAADRTIIACWLGAYEVGQYTLAALVVTGLQFIPFCLATVLYPRVAAEYGRTGSGRSLRGYFWQLLGLSVAIQLPCCLAAYALIEPFTLRFLPEYREGIVAAEIACLTSIAFAYVGPGALIAAMRRNTPYIAAILCALGLVWLLGWKAIDAGRGIVGVVWARTLATFLLGVFTIGFAFWLTSRDFPPTDAESRASAS